MDDHPGMSAEDWLKSVNGQSSRIEEPGPDVQQETSEDDDLNLLGVWDASEDDYSTIPPRGWLLGTVFCRKFLSSLIAEGGTGKSSIRILQLISLALGRTLSGERVHHRSPVLIVSLEDDRDELRRRVYAVLRHYNIDPKILSGWLYLAAPKGLRVAELNDGAMVKGVLEKYLRTAIAKYNIAMVALDPFIKTHGLNENDNAAMDYVCGLLSEIAIELECGIDLPHHTNKASASTATPGDVNRGRGGSSMKDAARLAYTLTAMTPEEAQLFGIDEAERRSFIRMDSAKVNIAPPSREAKWFRLVSVRLDNCTPLYPNGDEIQVAQPWNPPELWEGTGAVTLNTILDEIDAAEGLPPPHRYSGAPNAKDRAAWCVVRRHFPEKTEKQCRAMITAWLDTGLLYEQPYQDTAKGRDAKGLHVDPSKRPTQPNPL